MTAMNAFSAPISKFKTDLDLKDLYNKVSGLEYRPGQNNEPDQSINCFLNEHEDFSMLAADILEACAYHNKEVGYADVPLKITQMWSNKYVEGSQIRPHTHSNSFLSGVFTVSGSEEDATVFINPLRFIRDAWNLPRVNETQFSANYYFNKSLPGELTIFPSWLEHSSTTITQERYTISFNVVPTELGEKHALNYLKIT